MVTVIATIFVPPSTTTLFRGVEVELDRCSPRTRRTIETALRQGTDKPNWPRTRRLSRWKTPCANCAPTWMSTSCSASWCACTSANELRIKSFTL